MSHALLEAARSAVSGTNRNALLREYAALLRRGANDPASVADLQRLGALLGKGLSDMATDVGHLSTFDAHFQNATNLSALEAEAVNQEAAAKKEASDYEIQVKSSAIRRDAAIKARDDAKAAVDAAKNSLKACRIIAGNNTELFNGEERAAIK